MSRSEWVTIVTAIVVVVIISAGLWFYFRQRFVRMAEKVEDAIDAIIDGRELKTEELNKDTLFSKIQLKLEQLSEVTKVCRGKECEAERGDTKNGIRYLPSVEDADCQYHDVQ